MNFPDVDTLRLCSILASTAFGFVFAVLWCRNRAAVHFAIWAMSSLLYGGGMVIFGLLPSHSPILMTLAFATLGLTNVMPLAGVLALEGRRFVQSWMAIPIVSAACGHALPALMMADGWLDAQNEWQVVGDATGLLIAMAVPAGLLAFGPGTRASAGRRMAGIAMLCYLPAYILSIAGEFLIVPGTQLVALLAMLSDQVLLGVLNLGLLAIPIEQVQRQLRDAALRDPLTGCWNRGGLAILASAHCRLGNTVIALDVDRFKQINDGHGHAAGDAVLAFIGREARELAGSVGGQVVRQGGDEFLILIPEREDPFSFGSSLQKRLKDRNILDVAWSISLGVATVRAADMSLAETIDRADAALYQAKSTRTKTRPRRSVGAPVLAFAIQNRAAASRASR